MAETVTSVFGGHNFVNFPERRLTAKPTIASTRDVRGAPMRRDREDEFDLADIGGEAGAATHGASIVVPERRGQAAGHGDAIV